MSDASVFARFAAPVTTDRPVARRGHQVVSESAFRRRVVGWKQALQQTAHPRVALFEPDGVEFAAALVAAWYAGKVVYLPGDTQPETCHALAALGMTFIGRFPSDVTVVAQAADGDEHVELTALDSTMITLVIYTSGSSGAPQALHKQLRQLLAEVFTLDALFGDRVGDGDILATVSHQHIYGLLFKILWPLTTRRVFMSDSVPFPEDLVAHLSERRAAVISGPAHLKRLPQSLAWAPARAGVSAVFSSGGPLPLDAVLSVEQALHTTPIEVYGSSETGGIAWRQRTGGADHPWTPMPGITVRDDDGGLAVQSPHLPDNSWFVVADRVTFDDHQRFNLCGRADRLAKVEGKRVSLAGIEAALTQTGLVSDARVLLIDGPRDELGAVVVPSPDGWAILREHGTQALRARLDAAVAQSVERMARPRRWRWVDALPVNTVGKTPVSALARLFEPRTMTLPAAFPLRVSAADAQYELYVSPHLQVFDGHFENIPVLPGIAQLDWAIYYARDCFRITGAFTRLEAVKFHRLYQPGPLLSLDMQWRADRDMLSFRFSSSGGTHSSGRVFFAP